VRAFARTRLFLPTLYQFPALRFFFLSRSNLLIIIALQIVACTVITHCRSHHVIDDNALNIHVHFLQSPRAGKHLFHTGDVITRHQQCRCRKASNQCGIRHCQDRRRINNHHVIAFTGPLYKFAEAIVHQQFRGIWRDLPASHYIKIRGFKSLIACWNDTFPERTSDNPASFLSGKML
jgi:hypothetical protein